MTPVRGMVEAMRAETIAKARADSKRRWLAAIQSFCGSMSAAQVGLFLHPSAKVAADAMTDSMRYQMAAVIAGLDADAALKFLKDTTTQEARQDAH